VDCWLKLVLESQPDSIEKMNHTAVVEEAKAREAKAREVKIGSRR
jgi:hypothetical protein|tara:strand:+ start:1555 stop:1689 length:135 start_codon:yes stop_codon:yes gene_type:complete